MSRRRAEAVLVVIVMATSSSYLFTKIGTGGLPVFTLITLRFVIAFIACAIVFAPRILHAGRRTVGVGVLLGAIMFALLAAQAFGLDSLSTTNGSFLASTTVVIVPLIMALITHRRPKPAVIAGGTITMTGIALLTGVGGMPFTTGAILYLLSAVLYAVHIIIIDRFALTIDVLCAGIIELAFAAVPSALCMFALETPQLPQSSETWGCVLALGLLCSAFGLAMQPMAQQHTTPERYGVLFGLGPVFSAVLGAVFLHESIGVHGLIGAALVLAGVIFVVVRTANANPDAAPARHQSARSPMHAKVTVNTANAMNHTEEKAAL